MSPPRIKAPAGEDWGYGPGGPPPPKVGSFVEKPKPKIKAAPTYVGALPLKPEPEKVVKPVKAVAQKPKPKGLLEYEARKAKREKYAADHAAYLERKRIRQGNMTDQEYADWNAAEKVAFEARKHRREEKKAFADSFAAHQENREGKIAEIKKNGKKVQLNINYNVV